ncbi:hypothetical protein EGT07_02895 [Herbaspirillum sp. HC18]|nr:hypothetical protein EGT07_02895 [Herbaspirillum sp. HC18]
MSRQGVLKALHAMPQVHTHEQIERAVEAHLNVALEKCDPGKPTLVLIGESHTSKPAIVAELFALRSLQSKGFTMAMLELTPEYASSMQRDKAIQLIQRNANHVAGKAAAGKSDDPSYVRIRSDYDNDLEMKIDNAIRAQGYQIRIADALASGYSVVGFDPENRNNNPKHRESRQVESIKSELTSAPASDAGKAIAIAGILHLKPIHKGISPTANVITLAIIDDHAANTMALFEPGRLGYTLSTPDTLILRPSEGCAAAPIHYYASREAWAKKETSSPALS